MTRKQNNNLIPNSERTPEELRAITSKGGKASAEARRRRRDFKEIAQHLLTMTVKNGLQDDLEAIRSIAELKGQNITVADAIMIAITQNAMKGDIQSANYIRDITGQKPKDEVELTATVNEGKLGSILKQLEKNTKSIKK
ncbi:hypothetical protein DSECCO2_568480 [anaerobic digester metagenome]